MKLLVTGATGFVGWNAVRYFVDRGIDVVATYRSLPHYLQKVGDCPAVELELADRQAIDRVVARFQPTVILHAAAITTPQAAIDPDTLYTSNVRATEYIVDAAARHDAGVVFLSTDLVYPHDAGRCDESSPVSPSGAGGYARSKLDAEDMVRSGAARAIIVRPTLMFGDGPPRANSFSMFIERQWASGQRAPLFTDQYRSFLYVEDLLSAIEIVALGNGAWGELFVCGGPECMSRAEFGARYAVALGFDASMIDAITTAELPGYVGGPSTIDVDAAKLRSLGWHADNVDDAVARMRARRAVNQTTGDRHQQA